MVNLDNQGDQLLAFLRMASTQSCLKPMEITPDQLVFGNSYLQDFYPQSALMGDFCLKEYGEVYKNIETVSESNSTIASPKNKK